MKTRILLVDDDATFRGRLARALSMRGHEPIEAGDAAQALAMAREHRPHRALVDLRMPGRSGLELIGDLVALDPAMHVIVLTGYGSIATAVEAVRRGAVDYLNKPVDAEQILQAFERDGETVAVSVPEDAPSLARVEWEHVQRTLTECRGNISQAARMLGIHRRSLQRKLGKYPPER